ncbi:outer membrane protein assembly factor BamB [Runella defluvii]|uniref:Outer membrane protein assembly factor BamB n=1 Tax=Runella defluvii TaxID=370973 RepID=A0A7W5ZQX8_9BACT|nr:PQQ-binding-like beta-propeller repeat protein [Runella defluvii]MBB3842013.1 outer membrane protein assembly factor BamB [Runella defluvii]
MKQPPLRGYSISIFRLFIMVKKSQFKIFIFLYFLVGCTSSNKSVVSPQLEALTASFTVSQANPKLNETITFKDESKGNPTSWTWDFGDGTTSTQQNPTKSYAKLGAYTVKLTVSKTGVASQSATKNITVTASVLTLSLNTQNVVATANTASITLTANNSWTASSNSTWLKVSPISGNAGTNTVINFTVDANTTTNSRTGIVTFASGGLTQTYTLTQAGASIVSQGGTLYIATDQGDYASNAALFAIDINTGSIKWRFKTDTPSETFASPTASNGIVYFGNNDRIFALDAQNGNIKWKFSTGGEIISSPLVIDNVIYFGNTDRKFYALDANTGTKKWEFVTGRPITSSPTVSNGMVYFGCGSLYALDVNTGLKKWEFLSDDLSFLDSSPTVVNGTLYIGASGIRGEDGKIFAIDGLKGIKKWDLAIGSISSSPTVVNNIIYVGSQNNKVYAIDAVTGLKRWEFLTNGSIGSSSPSVKNNLVYIGSLRDKFYALDASNGSKKWEVPSPTFINQSSPTIAEGVVYIHHGVWISAFDALTGVKKWTGNLGSSNDSSPCVVTSDGKVYHSGISGYPDN